MVNPEINSPQLIQSAPRSEVIAKLLLLVIFWGTVWTTVLIVAGLGVKELIDPAAVDHGRAPSTTATFTTPTTPVNQPLTPVQTPQVQTSQVQAPQAQSDGTIWLFGTIVFGCVVGCILITQRLLKSPLPPKGKRSLVRLSSKQKLPAGQSKPVTALAMKGQQSKRMDLDVYIRSSLPTQTAQQPIAKPAVTLVPDDESHPLDWGEESLANLMDLRKRRDLSSFL